MRIEVPINYNDPHQTNNMMKDLIYILFPQGQKLPMPYTVDSNSTHYIIELDVAEISLTEKQEHELLLWKLRH